MPGMPRATSAVWHVPVTHREDINVVVALRAMGVESDQEAASLVGPEADFGALFLPSLEAAAEAGVVTQQQALQWLGAHGRTALMAGHGGALLLLRLMDRASDTGACSARPTGLRPFVCKPLACRARPAALIGP